MRLAVLLAAAPPRSPPRAAGLRWRWRCSSRDGDILSELESQIHSRFHTVIPDSTNENEACRVGQFGKAERPVGVMESRCRSDPRVGVEQC
jgi:hypothetical protein